MAEDIKISAEADISPIEQMNSALKGLEGSFDAFANTVSALDKQSTHLTNTVQSVAKQLDQLSSVVSGNQLDSFNSKIAKAVTGTEKLAPVIQKDIDAFQQLWKTINDSPLEKLADRTSNPVFTAQVEGTKYFIKVLGDAAIAAEVTSNKLAKLLSVPVADIATISRSAISALPEDKIARFGSTAVVSKEVKGKTFEHLGLESELEEPFGTGIHELKAHAISSIKQYLKETVFGQLLNDFDRNTGNVLLTDKGHVNIDFENTFANTQRALASLIEQSALFKNIFPTQELEHRLGRGQALQALPIPRDFIDEIVEKEAEIRKIVNEGIKDPQAIKLFNQRLQKILSLKNTAKPILADLLGSQEEIDAFKDVVEHLSRGKGVVQDSTLQKKLDEITKENEKSFKQVAGVGPDKKLPDQSFDLVPRSATIAVAGIDNYTRSIDVAATATINLRNVTKQQEDEFAKLRVSSGNVLEPVSTELRGSNALYTTVIDGTKYYVKVLQQEEQAAELAATAIGKLLNQRIAATTAVKPSQFLPTNRGIEPTEGLVASKEAPGVPLGSLSEFKNQLLEHRNQFAEQFLKDSVFHFLVNEIDRNAGNILLSNDFKSHTHIDFNAAFGEYSHSIENLLESELFHNILPTDELRKELGFRLPRLAFPIPKDAINEILTKENEIRAIVSEYIKNPEAIKTFQERFNLIKSLKDKAQPIFADLLVDPKLAKEVAAKLEAFKTTGNKTVAADPIIQKTFDEITARNAELHASSSGLVNITSSEFVAAEGAKVSALERSIDVTNQASGVYQSFSNLVRQTTSTNLNEYKLLKTSTEDFNNTSKSTALVAIDAFKQEANAIDTLANARKRLDDHLKETPASIAGIPGKPPPPLPPAPPGLPSDLPPEEDPFLRALANNAALAAAQRTDLIAGEVHGYKETVKELEAAEAKKRVLLADEIAQYKQTIDAKKTVEEAAAAKARVEAAKRKTLIADEIAQYKELVSAKEATAIEAKRQAAVPSVISGALSQVGISDATLAGLSPDRINAARNTISQLSEALRSGNISVNDLNAAVNALNTKSLAPLSVGATKAANALSSLQNTVSTTTETTKSAGKSILISLEGLFRIAERFFFGRFLYGIINTLKEALTESVKLETAFTRIQIVLNATDQVTENLKENTLALAKQFGVSTSQASAAAYQVLAGRIGEVSQATSTLQEALKLSKVTFSTTEEAAKTLTTAIKEYNLSSTDQERVAVQLFTATTRGRANLKDIDDLLGHTAISAHGLGIGLETLLNAFGSLGDRGVPAARATQTLNSLFGRLNQSGAELTEIFAKFGYESSASAVRGLGFAKALQTIVEEAKNGAGRTRAFAQSFIDADPNITKLASGISNVTKELERYNRASNIVADTSNEKWARLVQIFKQGLEYLANSTKEILILGATKLGIFNKTEYQEQIAAIKEVKASIIDLANTTKIQDISPLEQSIKQSFAAIRVEGQAFVKDFRARFINNNELIEESFENLAKAAKKTLQDINKEIKESQKFAINFAASIEKRSFERRISALPEADASREIQRKINELNARGQAAYFKGDKDSARKDFEEIGSLIEKNTDLLLKFYKNANSASTSYNKETRRHIENLDTILSKEGKLTKENIRDFDAKIDIAKRYAASVYQNPLQQALTLQEIEARRFALLVKRLDLERQQDLAAGGKTLKKFEGLDKEEANALKIPKDLEEQRASLIKTKLRQQTFDPQELLNNLNELSKLPNKSTEPIGKEFEESINRATAATIEFSKAPTPENYSKLSNALEILKQKIKAYNEEYKKSIFIGVDPNVQLNKIKEVAENINKIQKSLKDTSEASATIDAKIAAINAKLNQALPVEAIAKALKESKGHFTSINSSVDAFNTGLTNALITIKNIASSINEIKIPDKISEKPSAKISEKPSIKKSAFNPNESKDQLTALENLIPGVDPLDRIFNTKKFQAGEEVRKSVANAKDLIDSFSQNPTFDNFVKANKAIDDAKDKYRALLDILQGTLSKSAYESTSGAFDNITEALYRLQRAMQQTIETNKGFKLPNARSFAPEIIPNINPNLDYASNIAPNFEPSRPTETGFIPQVTAINTPQLPYNQPNNINNNVTVGDLIVNAQQNPQATAREIGQQLIREIKRGLIDLG